MLRRRVVDHPRLVYNSINFGLRGSVVYVVRLGEGRQILLLNVHLPTLEVLVRFIDHNSGALISRGVIVHALLSILNRLELVSLARVLARLK